MPLPAQVTRATLSFGMSFPPKVEGKTLSQAGRPHHGAGQILSRKRPRSGGTIVPPERGTVALGPVSLHPGRLVDAGLPIRLRLRLAGVQLVGDVVFVVALRRLFRPGVALVRRERGFHLLAGPPHAVTGALGHRAIVVRPIARHRRAAVIGRSAAAGLPDLVAALLVAVHRRIRLITWRRVLGLNARRLVGRSVVRWRRRHLRHGGTGHHYAGHRGRRYETSD